MSELRRKWLAWWLPFYYGPPCVHGAYGISYNEGIVLSCRPCMKGVNEECRRLDAEEKAHDIRIAFGPAFARLEKRLSALEEGKS